MKPSIEGWQTCLDPKTGAAYLEHRNGAEIVTFKSGAPVCVSTNGGRTWTSGTIPVHSVYQATIAADVILRRLRAERAARATSGGMSARDRQLDPEAREAEKAERRSAAQASGPQGRGALRRGREEATRRSAADPAPAFVRWDDATAADLARDYVSTALRASVAGQRGDAALFGVAVAIVRGFCLLPDGLGGVVLEDWNRHEAKPPWNPQRLRRALERAERFGSLPWGVLLAKSARGRELWGEWSGAASRSAGEGLQGRGATP